MSPISKPLAYPLSRVPVPILVLALALLLGCVGGVEIEDHHEDFAEAKKVEAAYVAQEVASAAQFPNGRRIPKSVHQAAAKQ